MQFGENYFKARIQGCDTKKIPVENGNLQSLGIQCHQLMT